MCFYTQIHDQSGLNVNLQHWHLICEICLHKKEVICDLLAMLFDVRPVIHLFSQIADPFCDVIRCEWTLSFSQRSERLHLSMSKICYSVRVAVQGLARHSLGSSGWLLWRLVDHCVMFSPAWLIEDCSFKPILTLSSHSGLFWPGKGRYKFQKIP